MTPPLQLLRLAEDLANASRRASGTLVQLADQSTQVSTVHEANTLFQGPTFHARNLPQHACFIS